MLIIDDDRTVCQSLQLLFKRKGYSVLTAFAPTSAMRILEEEKVDLVLLDMNFSISTSGKQGLETLRKILEYNPNMPVILMTGWATVQLAVEGMKIGAKDFLAKPWDNTALLNSVKTILSLTSNSTTVSQNSFERIITQSPQMEQLIETAKRVATTEASVLITGESGTGKELVAEAIHAASNRSNAPFVPINLGGVPESLFESELFGHKAGAFTDARSDRKGRFELAEKGTLFLDEIGDLSQANQVKLLRVLQERRYARLGESLERNTDIRLISATSRRIHEQVTKGDFREDLLYRINLIHLELPPLRARSGDVELLAKYFLAKACALYQREHLVLQPAAIAWLTQQSFPGNIRQLQNIIERVAILSHSAEISVEDLKKTSNTTRQDTITSIRGKTLIEVEEALVRQALNEHRNNITATAAALGITRAALYRRLDKFGIRHDH